VVVAEVEVVVVAGKGALLFGFVVGATIHMAGVSK
jgi:hypothetical protein